MPPALIGWLALGLLLGPVYFLTILFFRRQWREWPIWKVPEGFVPELRISVLIPARNEEAVIADCIRAVCGQNYPSGLIEILVIDDHSSDGTATRAALAGQGRVRVLALKEWLQGQSFPPGAAFKKKALEMGVAEATGDLIVTTDADCLPPPHWLALIASYFEQFQPVFLAGPVVFHREETGFQQFQSLDFLGMMLLTGAGLRSGRVLMANGANLAYSRRAFLEVNGYAGTEHLASGDDVFLLHKLAARFPGRIAFLRSPQAAVATFPMPDWRSFFRQRLRWATKNAVLPPPAQVDAWPSEQALSLSGGVRPLTVPVLALVFFLCWYILLSLLLIPLWGWPALACALGAFALKSAADYGMLGEASRFFGRQELMRSFWPSQLRHIGYIASVGLAANLVKQFEWKGRSVR